RDALRMVAGRRANYAPLQGIGRKARDLVVGAPDLEREDRLQILALEPHRIAEALRQPRHPIEWALDRHIIDAGGEDVLQLVAHGKLSGIGGCRCCGRIRPSVLLARCAAHANEADPLSLVAWRRQVPSLVLLGGAGDSRAMSAEAVAHGPLSNLRVLE